MARRKRPFQMAGDWESFLFAEQTTRVSVLDLY
jgi:hypothetical protein